MINNINSDSYAVILLCSDIALQGRTEKPFTLKQWEYLSRKLLDCSLRPSIFLEKETHEWSKELQLTLDETKRIEGLISRGAQVGLELERLNRSGIWVTTRAETTFPLRYKKTLRNQAPIVLYGSGDIKQINQGGVAIVGSRDIGEEGVHFTEKLAKRLADEGVTVISGGSRGVDRVAENTALSQGGKVVSVLSDGLENVIRKKEIRDRILKNQLVVVSAFHPGARFRGYAAMERNKHIYGLADYSVVVAASNEKSGTWAGASENLKHAWVPLFVRQTSNPLPGNESIIKLGGVPVEDNFLDQFHKLTEWFDEKLKNSVAHKNHKEILPTVELFDVVWPYFEKILYKDRTVQELTSIFNVVPDQIRVWMENAVKMDRVIRTGKGYKIRKPSNTEEHQQLSLF